MKIFFVRHGEAMDDVRGEYGGWADAQLSPRGRRQVERRADDLAGRGLASAQALLSSPLRRALQSAEIISEKLSLPVKEFVYLKERNTYGLLCGVNKKEAEERYPELVSAYQSGKPVFGYEDYRFFVQRVRGLVRRLASFSEKELVAVTHGKLLKALLEDVIGGYSVEELGDACLVVVELDQQGKLRLLETDGVSFASNEKGTNH